MEKLSQNISFFMEAVIDFFKDIFFWLTLFVVACCISIVLLGEGLIKLVAYILSFTVTLISKVLYWILVPLVFVGKWIMVVVAVVIFFSVSLIGGLILLPISEIMLKGIEPIGKLLKRIRFLNLLR
jgi:hypothetical protein